ncbi:MAG: hypothetical protein CK425_04020 [Parachlamydia sp.]|nr:MAG: hypothetical protein CK425_04020 [Parachlamydia sp.]
MSLSHLEITALVQELRPLLLHAHFLDAWEEGPRKIYLSFKTPDQQTHTLLLCFQEPFLRFHLVSQKSKWQQLGLSKKLFFHLEGSHLTHLDQVNDDRILSLSFAKGKDTFSLVVEFFSKRPNLFLLEKDLTILAVLNPVHTSTYQVPKPPVKSTAYSDQILSNRTIERKYAILEEEAEFEKEKSKLHREMQEKCKRGQRQIEKNREELKYLSQWPQTQHQAELLQANLYRLKKGMTSVRVQDWLQEGAEIELTLDSRKNPAEIVHGLYKKVKKMRGGLERCAKSSEQAASSLEQWQKALQTLEQASHWDDLQSIRKTWKISEPDAKERSLPTLPYHEYTSTKGVKIWVGKGAKENEKLTFSYAKGSDWWLHVRDFPGAHVVIRTLKGQRPDEGTLNDAFQIALAYSKAKDRGVVDILLTQCKYVTRAKQKTGQVHVSQHEIWQASFHPESFQVIKHRGKETPA